MPVMGGLPRQVRVFGGSVNRPWAREQKYGNLFLFVTRRLCREATQQARILGFEGGPNDLGTYPQ